MRSVDLVQKYFNREAERFDAIYDNDKPWSQQLGDLLFRRVILERFSLVINATGAPGRAALDVGCGPGRYGLELARRGASLCVGVDVAPSMIEIARRESERLQLADRCQWAVSEWLAYQDPRRYDAVIAMGYFDYLEQPLPHLEKMIAASRDHVFASFPKRWTLRTAPRKVRFLLAGGFVRFYDRKEILDLFRQAGRLECLSLVDLGRDFVAVYDAGSAAALAGARRESP